MEVQCPECEKFVTPVELDISDPTFKPEAGYTYVEHVCETCNIILFIERRQNEPN